MHISVHSMQLPPALHHFTPTWTAHAAPLARHDEGCRIQASANLTSPYNSQVGVAAYCIQDPLADCGHILAILFAPQRFGALRQTHAAHVVPHHCVHKGVPGGCPAPHSSCWWATSSFGDTLRQGWECAGGMVCT